jgi:hypothetical protein
MNRALSPRDRGGRTPRRQSGRCRLVPRSSGLVGRASYPPEREMPPGRNPAARVVRDERELGFDRVGPLPVFGLGRRHGQPHLLTDRTGQEPADGMRLPASGFHQFLGGYAARPLQQIQDLGGLAAVPGRLGLFLALGRFLGGPGLLARLGFLRRHVGALLRNTGLFLGFRLVACCRGLGGAGFFCNRCVHFVFSFSGDYCGHVMDHSGAPKKQANSGAGDGMAMAFQNRQMIAGGSR